MQTTDLDDLKELVAEWRAEHATQHDKEKRDQWTKYVSLTMGVIALGATALIVKKKPQWVVSTVFGALACAQMMYVLCWMPL